MPGPGLELVGDEEIEQVVAVLRSGYLGRYGPDDDPKFGATVYRFERQVEEALGVGHALAVNSGTSALQCILAALDIGPGDEVIVPGFTYVASISSVVYSGAYPVLAEVDETLNLDPEDVERRITDRTKAILAVHMMGNPARLTELKAIADQHGLHLIEDACQAFGAAYRGRPVGTIGVAGAVSFNIFKTLTSGDGGMVLTDDERLYQRAFAFHDQGHMPNRKGIEIGQRSFLGLNFRMTELSGAVLLAQFARLDEIRSRLRENKAIFKSVIAGVPGLEFRHLPDPDGDLATFLTVLLPDEEIARAIVAKLGTSVVGDSGWHVYNHMEHLLAQRTAVNRGCPFHCPDTYGSPRPYSAHMLPQTDAILSRAVNVGIGVGDPNLGSAFGVTVKDDTSTVRERAEHFKEVVTEFL